MAKQIFLDALESSKPSSLTGQALSIKKEKLRISDDEWSIGEGQKMYAIAVGKASRPMAQALRNEIGIKEEHILCITPDTEVKEAYEISSTHPVPDEKSVAAAEKLIHFIEGIPDHSVAFFALSGGASALICKPAEGIALEDINKMNKSLLESGAVIEEINSVRKHLSAIKGGQLLSFFNPGCTLIDLVISDVPGDDLEIIGSGPATPDSSTFQDAYETLLRYDLWDKCPQSICTQIENGLAGKVPETIKPGHDPIREHNSYIIGSARKFAGKMAQIARGKGFEPWIAEKPYNQPVEEVAKMIAGEIRNRSGKEDHPAAFIFYGESTVQVSGGGKGGRNQELALRAARQIKGMKGITWLSAGTDGIDGPTDAAGAIVDHSTYQKAEERGLDPHEYLVNNDSYHFHEQMGTLFKTGPTGNNVMDVVMVLIKLQSGRVAELQSCRVAEWRSYKEQGYGVIDGIE